MPCKNQSVPIEYWDKIHIVQLSDVMTDAQMSKVCNGANSIPWNKDIPGGFTHNKPQRFVYAFGNGAGYDATHTEIGDKWTSGFWTAAVHQSDVTLVTNTQPLPDWLQTLGLVARDIMQTQYGVLPYAHMFNVGVCNKYIDAHHEIAAHTDDNEWYVADLGDDGPLFASLTMYPDRKPQTPKEYARFQVFIGDSWCNLCLPDMSLLFMPSCIPHRVKPTKTQDMCTRINVTLRSIPSPALDPINSLRGVSNHVRYYQCPREMILAQDKETTEHVTKIVDAFNACLTTHHHPPLCVRRTVMKKERVREKKMLTDILRKAYKDHYKADFPRLAGNVTSELLQAVVETFGK